MRAALFDFDGTLTLCDTLLPFCRFVAGRRKFWNGLVRLTPALLGYAVKGGENVILKEAVLRRYIGGLPVDMLDERAEEFAEIVLPKLINEQALAILASHRRDGH